MLSWVLFTVLQYGYVVSDACLCAVVVSCTITNSNTYGRARSPVWRHSHACKSMLSRRSPPFTGIPRVWSGLVWCVLCMFCRDLGVNDLLLCISAALPACSLSDDYSSGPVSVTAADYPPTCRGEGARGLRRGDVPVWGHCSLNF